MTDSADSEFVLVETEAKHDGLQEWTEARFSEAEGAASSSSVAVIVERPEANKKTEGESMPLGDVPLAPAASSETNANVFGSSSAQELEELAKLQKRLDEESVARFVEQENAKAMTSQLGSSAQKCPCLGARQGIHRTTCVFHQPTPPTPI